MSTRAVIARTIPDVSDGFKGVYHHFDGYPTGLGKHLWELLHTKFGGRLKPMLRLLIDAHSAGWSTLMSDNGQPECYCHPKRKRRKRELLGNWFTNENIESDIEWVYAFNEAERCLLVLDIRYSGRVVVPLDGKEPDWPTVQCGEKLDRCTHYAYVHFPELKGTQSSRLSTDVYLGRKDFAFHDAVAVFVGGKTYRLTGSGYSAGYGKRLSGRAAGLSGVPDNAWISTVKAGNGRRLDIPTAISSGDGHELYPGVAWIFPPTKDNPNVTVRQKNGDLIEPATTSCAANLIGKRAITIE